MQLVDDVVEESKMAGVAKQLISNALGKRGLDRELVYMTKKDIYGRDLTQSKL